METKRLKLSQIKPNPKNPRIIKDDKFAKLVQSLKDFPEMADIRPIVVNKDMVILGGNMRYKAMKEAGWKDCPVIVADLTEEQQKEFIIKDNVSGGEWSWDMLANEWDAEKLEAWGLDLPNQKEDDEYTTKVESPIYEPKGEKPLIDELYDKSRCIDLINEINASEISEADKIFLSEAAQRHIIFNYKNIAEYYAHSDKKVQELMEKSALVIIDFDKAIENGFVKLQATLKELMDTDE